MIEGQPCPSEPLVAPERRLEQIGLLVERIAADRPRAADEIRAFATRVDVADGPVQAIHGDAHLANVLATKGGHVWIDWEESWRGPIEWDLATLDHRRLVFGEQVEPIGQALAEYGTIDTAAVDAWAPAVALWALAWGTLGSIELGEAISRNAETRRAWLARRFASRP